MLKTREEMRADRERLLRGERPSGGSVNAVRDVPQGFRDWVEKNGGRIARAKSLPYFLRDNGEFLKAISKYSEINNLADKKLGRNATKEGFYEYKNSKPITLTKEQEKDIAVLAKSFKIKVTPMNFTEADSGSVNNNYSHNPESQFFQNCQTCVAIFEARLRGLNITAKGYSLNNDIQMKLADNPSIAFRNNKGKTPQFTIISDKNDKLTIEKLLEQTKNKGRYHIGINFNGIIPFSLVIW
ncbi:MAG: hypothetical protein SPL47_03385 [Bacteroidales bacterium]|nr:hypothetical protein [Bacteroidales bacterium]